MLKEKERVVRRFLIIFDCIIVSFAYLLAFILRKQIGSETFKGLVPASGEAVRRADLSSSEYLGLLLIAVFLWCLMLYFNGMYRSMRTQSYFQILWIIFKAAILTFLSFATLLFLFKVEFLSRLFYILFFVLSTVLILVTKTVNFMTAHYVRREGYNLRRLLIVGTGPRTVEFIKRIERHPEWGFQIVGAIDDEPGRGIKDVNGVSIIGTLEDIPRIFREDAVDEVIFVVPRSRLNVLEGAIHDCEIEGVVVTIAVDLFDMEMANSSVTELDGIPLVHFTTTRAREWQLFVKRLIDITLSGLSIIFLGPLLLTIAVLIKMSSPGPVLFRQKRQGLYGRIFTLYKFRTMRLGAHEILSQVDDLTDMDSLEFRRKKIAWMTPIGRFMRKFSIDELPQLFNVLIGHMSIVGPRPTVSDEVEKYKTWQRRRLSMKPGITCLWQISGRNKIGFEEWMNLDLEYLDHWSLWLDIKILVKTIPVVLFGIGAY